MRLEIQMKSGHLPWSTKEQTSKQIDLQSLFNNYWTTTADEITVKGPSWPTLSSVYLIEKRRGRDRWEASLLSGTTILCKHYCSSLFSVPSQPADDIRPGGIPTLVAS